LMDTILIATGNNSMSIDLGADLAVLCDTSISIIPTIVGGTPPFTFSWSDFQFLGNNDTLFYSITQDTELSVSVEDACGVMLSDSIDIVISNPMLGIDIGPDILVVCDEFVEIEMASEGNTDFAMISWFWNGVWIGDEINLTLNTNEPGQLIGYAENTCGQMAWDTLQVDILNEAFTLSIDPVIMVDCVTLTTVSSNLADSTGYAFEWVIDGMTVGTDGILTYVFSESTEVVLMAANACGEIVSDSVEVLFLPSTLSVNAVDAIAMDCLTQETLDCVVSGGLAPFSYLWFNADSIWSTSASLNLTTNSDTELTIQVMDACGNVAMDVVEVTIIHTPLALEISDDMLVCAGESVELIAVATGGNGNIDASWQHLDDHPGPIEVAVSENAIYSYWAMDQCGQFTSAHVEVNLIDLTADFSAEYVGDYTVSFTNLSDTNYFSHWLFGDGGISYDIHPTHEFSHPDHMNATLFLQSGLCLASAMEEFIAPGTLYIPNCFTADANGLNEVIFAYGHNLASFHWQIFNRWGEKIFETNDLSVPWDGSHLNSSHYSPDGIYIYDAYAIDHRGNTFEKRGWILLIR
jgi:CHU_C Type IX secretion signal domain